MEIKIPLSEVGKIFYKVSKKRYVKEVNFAPLIDELSKLKRGGCLTYEHLEMISDENIWPFHKWWRWPTREQIDEQLKKTDGLFGVFRTLPKDHEVRIDVEKEIIEILYYDIFKHLELVSIVLRFIDEDNFAIYSPPVAKIIKSPRGNSYTREYLNYLKELRKYKDIYQLEKVGYVDMFLWAIEVLGEEREGVIDFFHRNLEKTKREEILNEIMKQEVLGKSDVEKAKFFLKVGVADTAAKWAGCAFEDVIRMKCPGLGIPLKKEDGKRKELLELIKESYELLNKSYDELEKIVKLRNKASHPSKYKFNFHEVKNMIDVTENLKNK